MKKVMVIGTGGTISGYSTDRLDMKNYRSGILSVEDIIAEIPEINQIANVKVDQLENFSSTSMTTYHWIKLKHKVEQYLNEMDYDGVVITHGTNTLEETAFFLNYTVNTDKPVILVGAMRPFSAIGTDACINLVNAIRVAADSNSRKKGVLVVLNDEINSARDVTKTNTYRLQSFQSGQLGLLGFIDPNGTVHYYRIPVKKHTINSCFSKIPIETLPEIPIVYSYSGSDGELIRFITRERNKYNGIVVAGSGSGRITEKEEESLIEAGQKGLIIVLSSRVENGRVVKKRNYDELNFITADNLSPQKARILLMLSLLISNKSNEIQKIFDEY